MRTAPMQADVEGGAHAAGTDGAHVTSLYRYPIKGLSPQPESSFELVAGEGLPADRRFALALGDTPFDPTAPEPLDKGFFLMLRRDERLAALRTLYDAASATLTVVEPDGAGLEADLSTDTGRAATERFFETYIGAACRGRPRLVEAAGHKFTDISVISPAMMRAVSVINVASVRDLGKRYGRALDPLRFRANIYVDDVDPWDELEWVGRDIAIGSALFRGVLRTRRCAAVDVDPATGERDTHIPRALMKTYGHPDCGVYLEVLRGGTIAIGDRMRMGS